MKKLLAALEVLQTVHFYFHHASCANFSVLIISCPYRAMVQFDDGSQRWARPNEIIMASELPVGQSVLVLAEGEDGFYLPGMVMGHSGPSPDVESEELFYQVERDDGVTQRLVVTSKRGVKILATFQVFSQNKWVTCCLCTANHFSSQ